MSQRLMLYSDGGARGNPGPAAIAFVALNEQGETTMMDSKFIGVHTNNQAEYLALLLGLEFALNYKAQEVICHLDSELVSKQLNGEYTVKNNELYQLWRKVQEQKRCFKKIIFVSVPREHPQIQKADALLNKTLDEQTSKPLTKGLIEPNQNSNNMEENSMFVHASIRTSDMERSIDFYSKLLGLRLQSRREIKQTNAEIAFLQDAQRKGCTLELTLYRNQEKFDQPPYENRLFDHLGFVVSNMDETIALMKNAGVTVTDEPFKLNENTTIAFIEDPDGTLIELIQHK
jgi:lactoylglutathione lyase